MKKTIQELLLDWFNKHQRALPWRSNYDPYHTWIAEIMMQQTQMDRGIIYYQNWIKKFPNIESVAKAKEKDLLKTWEGLGYYKRVQYIQKAACIIINTYGGIFPNNYDDIIQLPGIGAYTAGAIASTVFNNEIPCIDGNVERVLTRVFYINTSVKKAPTKNYIYTLAKQLIPKGKARNFNQALMELGALVCRKKPLCSECPIHSYCKSKKLGTHLNLPINNKKVIIKKLHMVTGILECYNKIFIQRRLPNDIWGGLWEFPGGCVGKKETLEEALIREWEKALGFSVSIINKIITIQHKYTNYDITLSCFFIRLLKDVDLKNNNKNKLLYPKPKLLSTASEYKWASQSQIKKIPLPSPHRKLASFFFLNSR